MVCFYFEDKKEVLFAWRFFFSPPHHCICMRPWTRVVTVYEVNQLFVQLPVNLTNSLCHCHCKTGLLRQDSVAVFKMSASSSDYGECSELS